MLHTETYTEVSEKESSESSSELDVNREFRRQSLRANVS